VAVRDFRDLVAWQLLNELRCEVVAFTATAEVARDFRYCNQVRDASAATTRDIAEGFGRYRPKEFARFCEYALGSLNEAQASLIDGRDRGYLEQRLFARLWSLSKAAERATKRLMFYLRNS